MSADITTKKRKRLLNIVEKLEKVAAVEESSKVAEVRGKCHKPSLLSPTVEVYSEPASPSITSEQESLTEDDKGSEWSETTNSSENQKGGAGPRAPMRCDVCGLRAYKSYRYINKTSAPQHLKNFVVPSIERFRVCKRCFSSRERCRQNLSLILLKSQMSQMVHVRTPLGVTASRATNALEYLARDMNANVKSEYEDELLACDETLGDEDDWGLDDVDDGSEFPLMNGYKVKEKEPKTTKVNDSLNSSCKQLTFTKNVGVVTVVRPQSGTYVTVPNCYTFYGETNKGNSDADLDTLTNELEKKSNVNVTAQVSPNRCAVEPFVSELHTINSKLTLLDHAYAQPMPKTKVPLKKAQEAPGNKPKPQKNNSKPTQVENNVKSSKSTKSPVPNKDKVQIKAEKTEGSSVRTCGIICHLCNLLVTKSYSCLTRDNAPDKVQYLFSKPEVKMVKVCRKCVPYKKPKPEEGFNVKGKIVKGKALLKATKAAKAAKANKALKAAEKNSATKLKALKIAQAHSKSKAIVNAAIMKSNQKLVAAKEDNNSLKNEVKIEKSSSAKQVNDITPTQNTTADLSTKKSITPPTNELERTATKLLQTLASAVAQNKVSSDNPGRIGELHATGTFVSTSGAPLQIMYLSKESLGNTLDLTGNVLASGTQSAKSLIGAGVRKIKLKGGCLIGDSHISQVSQGAGLVNLDRCTAVMAGKVRPCTTDKNSSIKDGSVKGNNSCQTESRADISVKTEKKEVADKTTINEDSVPSNKETKVNSIKDEKQDKTVKVKEEKTDLVHSPRTRNRMALGLPATTIITRKRSLSMSSEKSDKSINDKQEPAPSKKRILNALLLNRVKAKEEKASGGEAKPSTADNSSSGQSSTGNSKVKQGDSKTDLKKNIGSGNAAVSSAVSSKKKIRTNIVCGACDEPVVKSYRCLTVINSPAHIKPLFDKFSDGNTMLRICRRCLVESTRRRKRK